MEAFDFVFQAHRFVLDPGKVTGDLLFFCFWFPPDEVELNRPSQFHSVDGDMGMLALR